MDTIIDLEGLSFSYGKNGDEDSYSVELDSLCARAGEVLCIRGPSGCGKSTLLECLGLLRDNCSFKYYRILNTEVTELNAKDRLRLRSSLMGFMPQSGGLIPYLSVEDNLKLQLRAAAANLKALNSTPLDEEKLLEQSIKLFEDFKLKSILKAMPHELSIGQRQRAVFFKSLCHEPKLLLVDEPTSALDPENGKKLFETIAKVSQNRNMCVLLVTHNEINTEDFSFKNLKYEQRDEHKGSFSLGEKVCS